MTRPIRVVLLVVSSLAASLVALALLGWLLFDPGRVKQQLETALADALGMEVRIGQPPRFSLFGGASVTLAELEVSSRGQVVATAEAARVRIALMSMLAGQLRPLELHLQRPVIQIRRSGPGAFNIGANDTTSDALQTLSLRRLRVTDGRLSYLDQASGLEWLFERCDLDLRNIGRGSAEPTHAKPAADGELQCGRLSQERLAITDLSIAIRGHDAGVDLDVVSGSVLDGQLAARLEVDLSAGEPGFKLAGRLSRFDVGAFIATLGPAQAASGKMDLELSLTARGRAWQEVKVSAAGTLGLTSDELVLVGYDLDAELEGYAATQRFNLIDVGAVLLAGPFGLVASRGYAFTGLLEGSGERTRIVALVSNWRLQGGIAQARDVALRTPKNRLALAGGLDFTRYRFRELRLAVVDRDGCAIVEQLITGSFDAPEVKRPNFLVSVAGPLLNLARRGMRAISKRDCKVFYAGSIAHP